jgi:hypothetical protein
LKLSFAYLYGFLALQAFVNSIIINIPTLGCGLHKDLTAIALDTTYFMNELELGIIAYSLGKAFGGYG